MIPKKIINELDSPQQLPFDGQFIAKCPCHDDRHPSLYIKEDEETGNILLHCMAGCKTEDIVKSLGLEMKDFFTNDDSGHIKCYGQKESAYFYYDKSGVQVAKKVCYRNSDGSKTFCWFHLENEEWVKGLNGIDVPLYNLPSILNATGTVFIVEGEKDVDSLQKMGYIATTSPHGAGHKWDSKNYNKFFKNKDVVILADNDDVGRNHAKDVATCVSGVAKSVKLIPSENICCDLKEHGDISDIIESLGEEAAKDLLCTAVENSGYYSIPKTDIGVMPSFCYSNGNKVMVNPALLAEQIKEDGVFILVKENEYSNNNVWMFSDGRYRRCSDDEVKSVISSYITDYDKSILKMSVVKETLEIIKANSNYILYSCFDQDENIINFKNGVLKLDTMEFLPHSPEYLSTIQINAKWSENTEETPVFDAYLNMLTNNNEDLKKLLLQIIGLCISNVSGYRTKKCLFLVGEGNTGKTRIKLLVENIVGEEHCSSIDLSDLETRFGPSSLMGKRVAGSADLEFGTASQLKVLKQLVGGDTIIVEEKFKSPISFKFNGFLWFGANKMPFFGGDKGPWVYERLIIVPCNNVVPPEKRDPFIVEKMMEERDGIVHKAVVALKELIANNYKFSVPEICNEELDKYKKLNSSAISFFEECCFMRPEGMPIAYNDENTMAYIRKVFNNWCKINFGKTIMSSKDFDNEIAQYLKRTPEELKTRTSRNRYYVFTLTEEAVKEYRFI